MDENVINNEKSFVGDMNLEDFRRYGHQVVDWIADYLSHPERYPVLSQVEPNYLKNALPESAPEKGEAMDEILADIDRYITPGVTHWNQPAFFAYFANTGSAPGILGEMFAAAFNVNAMLWRTSPAATELEEVTTNWLRQMIGLPDTFSGVIYDTASISSLCAIAAAREAVPNLNVREEGLHGAQAKLRLYCSEHAHSSIDKAAIVLGLGHQSVRKIASDAEFRMKAEALSEAITEDRANGWSPFCVVATTGTTSTTSIDPVPAIAEICLREKLWLHIDAAYGGTAAILPEMRWIFEGSEHADSLVINPHKWMFVPMDLSVLFCRRMDKLRQAFSLVAEYLRTSEDEVKNFMDYGPQLGRRFRAIKLWFIMRYFGVEGIQQRIRQQCEMAREFADWVEKSEDFELLAPVPFSTVCFRACPTELRNKTGGLALPEKEAAIDTLNDQIMGRVNRRGKVFLSHTKLNNKMTLRLAIGNLRTTREHIKLAWDELQNALAVLRMESLS